MTKKQATLSNTNVKDNKTNQRKEKRTLRAKTEQNENHNHNHNDNHKKTTKTKQKQNIQETKNIILAPKQTKTKQHA